ncbi:MAG: PKD domain-containing protein [Haliscomenobacter sp.]|nr:PKD domain-containing protein [Haliscomenobacter sp.]MBK9487549.1 PKD domain-containing protein [Haliscomenobacter sp.]
MSKFGIYKAIKTIDTEIPHIDLPLAGLLTRLELGGFNLSPAEKVRLLQVISGPASVHWDEPQKLRYLLAPVIAHSKAEQERFYIIFDQYYAEILANATEADKAEAKGAWLKTLRTWLRKWWSTFPALLGLVLLAYFIYPLLKPETKTTSIGISYITPIRVGDTAVFTLNTKNIDTVDVNIHWSLTDKASGTIEAETDGLRTWQVPFTVLQGNPEKIITVDIHEKRRDSTFHFDSDLRIDCVNPPQLDGLGLPNNLPPGEDYTFTPNVIEATPDLQYHWDFGDGDSSTLRTPTHRYVEKGSYNVELKVTRPGLSGFCTTSTSATMRVGEDQVTLPWYDLQYAPVRLTGNYNWGLWVLIGLLAAAIFYSLFLWAKTQAPRTPEPPNPPPNP